MARKIKVVQPDYMPMGTDGMADMAEMSMPIPANTIPMMTGWGQFGSLEMGGMFTVVKVRERIQPGDYEDPGDYEHLACTVAYEWTGSLPTAAAAPQGSEAGSSMKSTPVRQVVPSGGGHSGH